MYELKVNETIVKNISVLEWEDNANKVFSYIDFTCDTLFEIGSLFELRDIDSNTLVFKGIITETTQTAMGIYEHLGYDFGFYLEKNYITIQFNGTDISQAFEDICRKYNFYIGKIQKIPATVQKSYINTKIADIIQDLLFIARVKTNVDDYYVDCYDGKFNIVKYSERKDLVGYLTDILAIKSTDTIYEIQITKSMMNMKNKVNILDTTGMISKLVPQESPEYIEKYGLLESTNVIDYGKDEDYLLLAQNRLKQLRNISQEISLKMLGNFQMKKGVIIPIDLSKLEGDAKYNGNYYVESTNHRVVGNQEVVKVNVRLKQEEKG